MSVLKSVEEVNEIIEISFCVDTAFAEGTTCVEGKEDKEEEEPPGKIYGKLASVCDNDGGGTSGSGVRSARDNNVSVATCSGAATRSRLC